MKNPRIYLDYNATAPLRPAAHSAVVNALSEPHNASSIHAYGRKASSLIEDARQQVGWLAGASASEVIFNSGATEGINTVLGHFHHNKILVSAIEHPAGLDAHAGAIHIPVTPAGVVDLNALEDLLKEHKPALVSVMMVNNETGAIQPIADVSALARKYGAMVHCDAVQAAGRIPVNMMELGIDFLTLSSHKIGGPLGAGALVLGMCGITPTLLKGGGQEKFARPGTENTPAIAGFGTAAQDASDQLQDFVKLAQLRDKLESMLGNNAIIYAKDAPRIANTSLFALPGVSSEMLLMNFDLEGIALSNGSACTSGKVEPSHVLKAMGASDEEAKGAIRVSMGWDTKAEDIDAFLIAWHKIRTRIS